jgi:hypothetical protein
MMRSPRLVVLGVLAVVLAGACGSDGAGSASTNDVSTPGDTAPTTTTAPETAATSPTTTPDAAPQSSAVDTTVPSTAAATHGNVAPRDSTYLDDYTLIDDEFGTEVTVTVSDVMRTIEANALPNHETGRFPNADNPNTITAQNAIWEFPTVPVLTGEARFVHVPGVSVNGVKFEPATAETVVCATGETYQIEALQDVYALGFDTNNAHVQPNGEYHYHGVSQLMVESFNGTAEDLVHVGFAADGHLIYYSKSGAYPPSYRLETALRTGTDCQPSLRNTSPTDFQGSTPDGAYTSDWVFDPDSGVLDACNGTTIDGVYVYLITEGYPFVSRCLMGDFAEQRPGGAPADGSPPPPRP